MERLLDQLPVRHVPIIITGDFNMNLLDETHVAEDLIQLMSSYGFSQNINQPTHREGGLLDHIYTNAKVQMHKSHSGVIDCYYTDHQATYFNVSFKPMQRPSIREHTPPSTDSSPELSAQSRRQSRSLPMKRARNI
jgi:endonuclease/exonuclease/phosphatase family metal-dependent hydrolase